MDDGEKTVKFTQLVDTSNGWLALDCDGRAWYMYRGIDADLEWALLPEPKEPDTDV